jgi:hypothetical protein
VSDEPRRQLSDEHWRRVDNSEACLAFLLAEWDKEAGRTAWYDKALIENPDLADPTQNAIRRLILGSWRAPLLDKIPVDTTWFRVDSLREAHLHQLFVIGSDDWRDPEDHNELLQVGRRRGEPLDRPPSDWHAPLLWGHGRSGPFTILEGNNRLVNYAATRERPPLEITCFIGLSPSPCVWHEPDRPFPAGA